jgi:hypothetical protein
MSLLKLFVAGFIVVCISILGSFIILVIFGTLAVPFVEWLESNPTWRGVFALVSIILFIVLFLAFSKWVLKKVV